ncbi:MAG: DUF4303 domain-containing protein [Maribacter sp.]
MNTTINFDELKNEIEHATRISFKENVERFGSELCAFSLISDDGAMTVVPYINTKSHLDKMQAENLEYKESYEFEPAEWFTSGGANTEFNAICKSLCDEIDNDELDFEAFRKSLFETCFQVLEKLRKENFFLNELDKDILLMFSISDTSEPKENLLRWMQCLNSTNKGKRFEEYIHANY